MPEFDPWNAPFEEAEEASFFDEKARHKWAMAGYIKANKTHFELHPISGVAYCLRAGLNAPHWLASAYLAAYEKLENFTVASLDEAFGHTPEKGKHLSTRRLEKQHGMNIQIEFMLAGAPPRTPAGRERVAKKFGLTEKQVRTLLQKTRTNLRGHKPYYWKTQNTPSNAPIATQGANDPFGLAQKVPKK